MFIDAIHVKVRVLLAVAESLGDCAVPLLRGMLRMVMCLSRSVHGRMAATGPSGGQDCEGACREGPYRDTPAGPAAASPAQDRADRSALRTP